MTLFFREFGDRNRAPSLVLLHGLLGSSVNWYQIARQLETRYHVLVPDLRNHGRSFHDSDCGYPAMAADLVELLDQQAIDNPVLIGHSMGGKVAMWVALHYPECCSALVSVDISPVAYPDRFSSLFALLSGLRLEQLGDRTDADRYLADHDLDKPLRDYLLQNLIRENDAWRWRINLQGLSAGVGALMAFPLSESIAAYRGPTLFIAGGSSDYVKPDYYPRIESLFSDLNLQVMPGVGHWVYAEDLGGFMSILEDFLLNRVSQE